MVKKKLNDMKPIVMFLILAGTFVIGSLNAEAQTNKELLLNRRVDLFYKYFTDGEIDKLWQLVSTVNREEKESEKRKKYETLLQKLSHFPLKVCTKDIKIDKNRAVVTVEISIWDEKEQIWLGDTNRNVSVFEDKNWFFKSQIEK